MEERGEAKGAENKENASCKGNKSTYLEDNANLVAAINRIADERHAENDENSPQEKSKRCWDKATTIGIYVAAMAAIVTIIFTHLDASQQVEALKNQLALDHPPHLQVMNIFMSVEGKEDEPVILTAGVKLRGAFPLFNNGRDDARINDMRCEVKRAPALRMQRSFFSITNNNCGTFGDSPTGMKRRIFNPKDASFYPFIMKAGDGALWNFETIVPTNYLPSLNLYIWGVIRYSDRASENRYYLFADHYDPGLGRFVREDNPDYEGQDTDLGKK